MACAVFLSLVGPAAGLQFRPVAAWTRREAAATAVAAAAASLAIPRQAAHAKLPLGPEEQDRLDLISRSAPEQLPTKVLPSGVTVYEMHEGTGRRAEKGDLVYAHFKLWTGNFRKGPPLDSSIQDTRPYDWILGQPDERMRKGFDEGIQGMREDGWRRIVVPAALAYGTEGKVKPGGRGIYLVPPDETVFLDVVMIDAGTGKCAAILRPEGVTETGAKRLKSLSCVRNAP